MCVGDVLADIAVHVSPPPGTFLPPLLSYFIYAGTQLVGLWRHPDGYVSISRLGWGVVDMGNPTSGGRKDPD